MTIFRNQLYRCTAFIFHVTKSEAFGRADRNTSGLVTLLDPVCTESAFVHIPFRMDVPCIVRAGCDASLAPGALGRVDQNRSIVIFIARSRRANADAGSLLTMMAPFGTYLVPQLREVPFGDRSYPVPMQSLGRVVFGLARNHAVHTPDAFSRIDNHS